MKKLKIWLVIFLVILTSSQIHCSDSNKEITLWDVIKLDQNFETIYKQYKNALASNLSQEEINKLEQQKNEIGNRLITESFTLQQLHPISGEIFKIYIAQKSPAFVVFELAAFAAFARLVYLAYNDGYALESKTKKDEENQNTKEELENAEPEQEK